MRVSGPDYVIIIVAKVAWNWPGLSMTTFVGYDAKDKSVDLYIIILTLFWVANSLSNVRQVFRYGGFSFNQKYCPLFATFALKGFNKSGIFENLYDV